jgi:hypothetical protein
VLKGSKGMLITAGLPKSVVKTQSGLRDSQTPR